MNRISGSLAVLAGFFLMLPGIFALISAASSTMPLAGWVVRDLIVAGLSGAALLYWGASSIRHRELELYALKPVRVRGHR